MESHRRESQYQVKTVLMASGERFPMLLEASGLPMWEPTVYVLTELRARNRAANTIENTLRALMVFHVFLQQRGINLSQRTWTLPVCQAFTC